MNSSADSYSIRQLTAELDLSYKTLHRRVERFTKALDAPSIKLSGPVEIGELYVSAGLKGRERDGPSRSRGLSTRGRGTYEGDKLPVFTLVDRGNGERYVVPAKSADESTVRLLLAGREKEPLTVYTDGSEHTTRWMTTSGFTASRSSMRTTSTSTVKPT